MKKVLQISNYLFPHIGGVEQVAKDIADSLAESDEIEQKIICFNENAQVDDYVCRRSETVHDTLDGIEVIRCGCFTKVASQSLSVSYASQLSRVIKDFKPDTIILHYPNPFTSAFLLRYMPNETRFILYWHLDITKQKVLGKLFHMQTLSLLKRADTIVATSPNYMECSPYLSQFKEKCIIIPNCIRPEKLKITAEISTRAEEIRNKYHDKTICFAVGRHVPYKGMSYLLKASKYLDNNYAILIGGKGELTASLKEEAKGDEKVEFLGRVSNDDLVAYYMACDIFCFPSITKNEAFGIALAEGMYFEKPTVTFTIPGSGVNYVSIADKTGIECPNGDSEEFAEAIKKLHSDSEVRFKYGKAAKERVVNNFMFEQFKETIKKLLLSMM